MNKPDEHIFAILTSGLIVVDVDSLQLKVRITVVRASGINAVFVGDDLPELKRITDSHDW